jgi:hypothetical protein
MKKYHTRSRPWAARKTALEPEDRKWKSIAPGVEAQVRGHDLYHIVLRVNRHELRLEHTFGTPKQALDYVETLRG